jgi:mono/diheme cytochrome c family protein
MNYPFWDVPHFGSAWVIGAIAIFHVMISHFAVGGGLYLPMAEYKALKEGRQDWILVLRQHSKFFLVLTGVFGAVSGVGIWFSIGLAHPEATSTLIHNFVFGWAIEWVFFMVELSTAAVYYYTWGRIPKKLHLMVGWVYAFTSFLTLVIINGILSFMLTPSAAWLEVAGTGQEASRFWQAFFNPTYWPSLFLRTLACVSLAGVWALVTCSRIDETKFPKLKPELVRWSAKWLLPSFFLLPFCLAWYLWMVPESQRVLLQLGINTIGTGAFTQVTRTVLITVMTSASIVGVVYFFAWRSPNDFSLSHAIAVIFLALCATGSTEYAREMLRKPYVIGQHMFSNGIRIADVDKLNRQGYLTNSLWVAKSGELAPNLAMGQAMFRGQCKSCHTDDVYRSMKKLLAGRSRDSIDAVLTMLHDYKKESLYRTFMPPLVGTKEEISALGDFLVTVEAKNRDKIASKEEKKTTPDAPAKKAETTAPAPPAKGS